jgi:hypothetical protein
MHTRSHVAGCAHTRGRPHHRAMRILILAAVALAVMAGTALAGKQVKYIGIHPIAKAHGGGFCHIEGPHVHIYAADKVQYRDHRGHHHFVGDPVAYGYDGPRHVYKGHHPIHVHAVVGSDEPDVEFCYLDGPHYHYFMPPEGPEFKVVGGAYFYVAEPPKVYVDARPAMIEINAIYKPLVYTRPVVTVEAPPGWIGARVELIGPPAVVVQPPRARVVAPAPGVSIDARVVVPVPSVRVEVGVPGVIIHERGPRRHGKHKKHKKHRKWR